MNYTKKLVGHKSFESSDDPDAMQKLYRMCVDNELVKLTEMYGDKAQSLLYEVAWQKFSNLGKHQIQIDDFDIIEFAQKIQREVAKKLRREARNVRQFSHALDEEQQKELEQEQEFEEERQVDHSFVISAAKPAINETIKSIVENGVTDDNIDGMTTNGLLYAIADSLSSTQLHEFCQNNRMAWAPHIYVSKDFKTVIEGKILELIFLSESKFIHLENYNLISSFIFIQVMQRLMRHTYGQSCGLYALNTNTMAKTFSF